MSSEQINLEEMGKNLKKLVWDEEDLEHAKQFIKQISYLSDEKFMQKDFEGLEEFEYFIANNNKILIPTIGQYSSGKSSLLNILIGEEYLPTSEGVCTNVGIIIEYTSNKNISELYEINLEQSNKYFSFKKSKIICNDKTKIKDTIDKRNKEHRFLKLEDSFLLLKVNIKLFESLKEEKNREKILLIDFPGLDVLETKNFFSSDVLSPLINQSDSFIFINSQTINTNDNQKIIVNLVEKIKNRKISFSYKNCLFIMNKWDKLKKNDYSLTQAKNDLKEIFQNNLLDDIFDDIDIINCSAKNYKNFEKKKNDILNFERYIENSKNNFEEEYELNDEHNEDEDKNDLFYKYIINPIKSENKNIKNLWTNKKDMKTKENYFEKLNNILKDDYQLEDGKKKEIINDYLTLANNIDNHELLINSNIIELKQKILEHMLLSIENLEKNIENKGMNFLKNINNTINFVLKRLDNPKKTKMKYSKIEQSEKKKNEIQNIFVQFKGIIKYQFQNYIFKEDENINKYTKELDKLFEEKIKGNNNLSNKIILGQIEKEKIDELKKNKMHFYGEMKEHFKNFINEVNKMIKILKNDINIDENSFIQEYFETSDTTANSVNAHKSWFWQALYNLTKKLRKFPALSEYILHKKILFDDKDTIINKSIENFCLVKQQNKEILKDFIKIFMEQLDEFEKNVKDEVQKMIDLSYSDYTKFKTDSKKIINSSAKEFNTYIKNKYNRSSNFEN